MTKFLYPFILLLIIATGTAGFMFIEGWDIFESLYMTIITLTTVGYQEIKPLSQAGKIFNLTLIITGVSTVTIALTKTISDIASIDFKSRRRLKMKKEILKMSDHTIVCGYGRMGEVICDELLKLGNKFVVIEKREALIEAIKKTSILYIEGDAANDDNLIAAGIKEAKVLVSVIDNDSDGLYIALASRSMNKDLFIYVRANEPKAKKRILRAGADKVILPFVMSGRIVAEAVVNPATEDIFDITEVEDIKDKNKIQLADLMITKESTLVGKSVAEAGEDLKNLIIIGIKTKTDEEDNFLFKPAGAHIFTPGEHLVTMGPQIDYENAKKDLCLQ